MSVLARTSIYGDFCLVNRAARNMYTYLLFFHSLFRWFVLTSLVYAIFRAYRGYASKQPFTKTDNAIRHWTATIAHIQLLLGFTLYMKSPIVNAFFDNPKVGVAQLNIAFFSLIHFLMMLVAIVVITIGSALSKRKPTDADKFRTMGIWFAIALFIIFLAIPWPFSPLANRPYFRPF